MKDLLLYTNYWRRVHDGGRPGRGEDGYAFDLKPSRVPLEKPLPDGWYALHEGRWRQSHYIRDGRLLCHPERRHLPEINIGEEAKHCRNCTLILNPKIQPAGVMKETPPPIPELLRRDIDIDMRHLYGAIRHVCTLTECTKGQLIKMGVRPDFQDTETRQFYYYLPETLAYVKAHLEAK
jgi:hypothetical protein